MLEITPSVQAALVRKMRPYRKTAHTLAVQVDEPFVIRQDHRSDGSITGNQYCNAGDYLALSTGGGVYGIPKRTFESSYESVS